MSNLASPCVRNCCLNKEDICIGCFRSLTEIMQWGKADDHFKLQVLSSVKQRKKEHQESRVIQQKRR